MSDEPTEASLRLAIADPGATTPRLPGETLTPWTARAVIASDWFAQARRESAAEALDEAAEHPYGVALRGWLRDRAKALRGDS